jgi:hypothetical protein
VRERDRLEVGHGLREAVGHGLRSSARRRCDLQGARERPARGGSRLREAVGHGCDPQIGDAPHKLLNSYNFTLHYFNIYIYIYILIEFKFYSIIKHLIRILTYYIFFNRNNILFHIYKHNHNKCLIL